MPRWRLSLPPPAAPTTPSRLHRSSLPIAVDSPSKSLNVELQSCRPLPSIAVHHRPSPCRPSLPSRHHTILIRPLSLQSQSIAIALALSLTVHHHQRAVAPSIAVNEQSLCPYAVAPHRPSPSRSHPSLSIRLLLSSRRRFVHCCPSLLSRRRAITVHRHRARAVPHRTSPSKSRHTIHRRQ